MSLTTSTAGGLAAVSRDVARRAAVVRASNVGLITAARTTRLTSARLPNPLATKSAMTGTKHGRIAAKYSGDGPLNTIAPPTIAPATMARHLNGSAFLRMTSAASASSVTTASHHGICCINVV